METLDIIKAVYEAMPQVFTLADILQNKKIESKQCKRFLSDEIVAGRLTIRTINNLTGPDMDQKIEVYVKRS